MAIPEHAEKVFSWVIFDVYQWKQELFDGSFSTFESIKRTDSVLIIPTDGKDILIAQEEQPWREPFYGLFGGRREPGESPIESAKRELLEETGMESNDWVLYKTYPWIGKVHWPIHIFIARNSIQTRASNPDQGEKIEVCRISFEKLIEMFVEEEIQEQKFSEDILRMKLKNALGEFKHILFPGN